MHGSDVYFYIQGHLRIPPSPHVWAAAIQRQGERAGRQRGARIDSLLEDRWQTFIFKCVNKCTLCQGALALVHSAQTDRGQCSVTWGDLMKIPSIWTTSINPLVMSCARPLGCLCLSTFPCKHGDSRSGIRKKKKETNKNWMNFGPVEATSCYWKINHQNRHIFFFNDRYNLF